MKPLIALLAAAGLGAAGTGCSSDTMSRLDQKHPSAVDRIATIHAEHDPGLADATEPGLEPVAEGPMRSPAWGAGFGPY
jgi:hypothetical protein